MAQWIVMDERQRSWLQSAINYYKARIAIYELMIEEWHRELDTLKQAESPK